MTSNAYADTEKGQVHYRYAGEIHGEAPTIVCFHQNPSTSRMFEELLEELSGDYGVVAPDMPGYGMSYTPDDVPSFSYYTRVLTEAIDTIGVEECHVVGHHTGAGIGAEVATNQPDRIQTATFVGPPYFTSEERERLLEEAYPDPVVPPIRADGSHLLDHWELFDGEGASPEIQHRMVLDALLSRAGNVQSHEVGREQDFPMLFERIEAPRLLMCAPGDVLWEAFERARETNPGVRAVEVGGGSWEPLRDVGTVAQELRSFLADHGY